MMGNKNLEKLHGDTESISPEDPLGKEGMNQAAGPWRQASVVKRTSLKPSASCRINGASDFSGGGLQDFISSSRSSEVSVWKERGQSEVLIL